MIVITGGAGFIGSNIVAGLNRRGYSDILVVDHLKNGKKMLNLADLDFVDYLERDAFIDRVSRGDAFGKVEALFHLGACSSTTEWDGQFMMRNNFDYSKTLLHWCQAHRVPFLYASSASVYGMGDKGFKEQRSTERPLNMYAFSKFQFDQYLRHHQTQLTQQVVGLRYFNVYGPHESHKGTMSSTVFHFSRQVASEGVANLFCGTDGYGDGEQQRDFVFVEDCVDVNLWFLDHPDKSGIFNVGTGRAQSFNDVANAVIAWHQQHGTPNGEISYIPFPEHLRGAYQSYTCADISALRQIGYSRPFQPVESGVPRYLDQLNGVVD
ncbi:MAG: ADP-glyceromanno-heptose 6-epimerase [Gammaproteobacteria bacterium]|nr:ADP-glyceromanno-heptose 6-epimerase [Gammaproteobacteria bacterium]